MSNIRSAVFNQCLLHYFFGVFLLLLPATKSLAQKSDAELIKQCFNQYKDAILNDKGEEAIQYVDDKTIKYYEGILGLTKNADSTQLENTGLLDKFIVLAVRHRVDREKILSFDGEGLLVYAIENGMVGKNGVVGTSLGEVTVFKEFAKAQIIANGETAPYYFHFYKNRGDWKLNLTSLFSLATAAFKNIIAESGKSDNDFFFQILEMMNGKKVSNKIWKPITSVSN